MSDITRLTAALADRYRLERELGAGGMATVYLAHDLKHDRKVAIKVLKPELGAVLGAERFLSEIKVTANLQHPNLLALFDSGEAAGLLFYVMPYVEGETLRARLDREKQLPVDEAVRIASAIASALHYAHERGVIHRDLKPENVLVQAGQPVIADFGIALAVSNAGGARVTQTGLSLGTPQYMSPEQATGDRQIDARSDIYALGAVTFEMLAGDPPHVASTAQAIVAKVLTETPPLVTQARPAAGEGIAHAVAKALAKLPADRWSSAQQFADALQRPSTPFATSAAFPASQPARPWSLRSPLPWAIAFVAATAAAVALAIRAESSLGTEATVTRFAMHPPEGREFARTIGGVATFVAVSPDGQTVIYQTRGSDGARLYSQRLDELTPRPFPEATAQGVSVAFSPDGRWIAMQLPTGKLVRAAPDGTNSADICETGLAGVSGLTWLSNDEIVFGKGQASSAAGGFWRVKVSGGEPREFTKGLGGLLGGWAPRATDDGRHLLFTITRGGAQSLQVGLASVTDGTSTAIAGADGAPLGIMHGHLIYVQLDGALMAAPFDLAKRSIGPAIKVGDSVAVYSIFTTAVLSRSGTLVYTNGQQRNRLVRVSAQGEATPLLNLTGAIGHPRLSPDGRRLAFDERESLGGTDVWVATLDGGMKERITRDGTGERPEWTPDGRSLLFPSVTMRASKGVALRPVDGSRETSIIAKHPDPVREAVMDPDGQSVVIRVDNGVLARDIYRVRLSDGQTTPLVATDANEKMPRLSPDGRWLAYVSNSSGPEAVYLRSAQPGGGAFAVSAGEGSEPLWSRDGTRLFYRTPSALVEATLRLSGEPTVVSRRTLFARGFLTDPYHPNYDVYPDGQSFVMVEPVDERRQLVVVRNWGAELRRRIAAAR